MEKIITKTVMAIAMVQSITMPSYISEPEVEQTEQEIVIEEFEAEITGYSSEVSQTDDTPFIMANGKTVHEGAIACPYRYDFGTIVEINDIKYVCEDRMNRRFPDRFDIWFATKEYAIDWGKQILTVKIIQQ